MTNTFQYYTFTLRRQDLHGCCMRKITCCLFLHFLLHQATPSWPPRHPPPPSAITTHWSRIEVHSKHPPACRLWCFARFIRKTQFSCFPGNDSGWLELPGTKEIQMWLPEDSGPALACPHTGTSGLLSCPLAFIFIKILSRQSPPGLPCWLGWMCRAQPADPKGTGKS